MREGSLSEWVVVCGMDGSGKTTLVRDLAEKLGARRLKLPFHAFVKEGLKVSGAGEAFGDPYTDRLLMAVDIRLVDVQIRKWRGLGERLVSQRGWVDQFVFGAVQGFSYLAMDEMLRTKELSSATAYIHLTCQASVAHERIRNDEGGDKFETLDFMVRQEQETRRCFEAIRAGEAGLESFSGAKHWLLDTTQLTMAETLIASGEWLASVGIA